MSAGGYISVIGGVNVDISASLSVPFVPADSNPGRMSMCCGGVGYNVAHNLRMLYGNVRFLTVFGGDSFGQMCLNWCRETGLDLSAAEQCDGERNGVYLCINNVEGDMIAAVVDNDIARRVTPEWLEQRIDIINSSVAVVADTNLSTDALTFLIDNCSAPLFVDAVSTAKAPRVMEALQKSQLHRLHTLKLNRLEAQAVTGCDSVDKATDVLLANGVQHVYITLGSEGALCAIEHEKHHFDSLPVDVVNTTGAGDAFVAGLVYAHVNDIGFATNTVVALKAAKAALMTSETVNPDIARLVDLVKQ